MKRIFLIIFLGGILLNPTSHSLVKNAYAVLGVGDVVSDPILTGVESGGNAATAANAALTEANWLTDKALPTILAIAKKRILDLMVDQTVAWIQGEGRPQFIQDYKAFFGNVANVAVGDLVKEIGGPASRICEPFKVPLQQIITNIDRPFSSQAACTLNGIVDNVENFYNDFAQGGWLAYSEALQPQNNIYGAYILAEEEKDNRAATAADAAAKEVQAGGGFLSQKKCLFWSATYRHQGADGKITDQVVTEPDDGKNKPPTEAAGFPEAGRLDWKCTQAEIITPGKTVGDVAAQAVGSDFNFIINANDVSAYTAAIADAAISRLTRETFRGLAGLRKPTININDAFVGADNSGCAGLTGRQRELCLSGDTQRTSNEIARDQNSRELLGQFDTAFSQVQSGLTQQENQIDSSKRDNDFLIIKIASSTARYIALQPDQGFPALNDAERVLAQQIKTNIDIIAERATANTANLTKLKNEDVPSVREDLTTLQGERGGASPDSQFLLEALTSINERYLNLKSSVTALKNSIADDNRTIDGYITQLNALPGGHH